MTKASILPMVMLLSACALPQTTVKTGAAPPTVMVKGAPAGSILFVDGLAMGSAPQFDGNPKTLAVLEGTHLLEVRLGSSVVYKEKAFASSGESHTVTVSQGAAQ
ncbi:MAG: hypothetical protein JWN43_1666 [Gammaproteobacteria bacterium]|nr:hypothetical protein [Gammaproteobacteria bacterium]